MLGATLFTENFEAYSNGSNLAGQGGWSGCGSIPINAGSGLPTKVARVDSGSGGCSSPTGIAFISHLLGSSLGPNTITTLSFDAFAPVNSHNYALSLNSVQGTHGIVIFTNFNIPGWQITLQDTSTFIQIPGGLGMPVSFNLVVDQQAQIAYALYNFGSGTQTSATLSLVGHTELSQADAVSVFGDYRFGTLQGQFDNIVVSQTTTPEPSSLWIAGFSLAGLLTLNRFTSRKVME